MRGGGNADILAETYGRPSRAGTPEDVAPPGTARPGRGWLATQACWTPASPVSHLTATADKEAVKGPLPGAVGAVAGQARKLDVLLVALHLGHGRPMPPARQPSARRFSMAAGCGGVAGRAEAAMDVVVDHAGVLHERVHTRRPHEAVPLRLQLPGERLRLRGRRGQAGKGPRCPLAGDLAGPREHHQARRRGQQNSLVVTMMESSGRRRRANGRAYGGAARYPLQRFLARDRPTIR
jgi:hypothetical protein